MDILHYITCTYFHTTTVNEQRSHRFEGKQGGIHERIWKEERKGNMMLIYYSLKSKRNILKGGITL